MNPIATDAELAAFARTVLLYATDCERVGEDKVYLCDARDACPLTRHVSAEDFGRRLFTAQQRGLLRTLGARMERGDLAGLLDADKLRDSTCFILGSEYHFIALRDYDA